MSTFGICITPSRVQPEVHSEFQTYLKEMGNPFIDESAVLHALYYNDILQDTVVRTIGNIETLDEELHSEYVEQRLQTCHMVRIVRIQYGFWPFLR